MDWTAYLPMLWQGAFVTMTITLASIAVGAVLAFVFGIMRVEGGPILSTIALCYTEVFRGTSLLVQLFWFYYALPLVGLSFDPITTGILVLAAHAGGYGAEIVRGALSSVSTQQLEAARALNFSRLQTLFRVSLPQAIVEMMPAFGNLAIETLKLSSLVSLISIADLTFAAQSIRNITLDSTSIYSITLLCYFAMSLVLMVAIRVVERLVRRGQAFPQMPRS
ncbi:ectoine/hydroxyectoine ABC transporter permease subunit EhuC [Shinella sp. AETb1-6]|jgi:polar amino acid transport system permease protein|uniref:Ectoine/hydroxyectoine ABC transporter permease subunit EhuC n=1 Tax=Shinella oryzae TaxID=2871820 RepID=A0ABY9KD14_9HYPH|nr:MULTISPECIES: ectoine/hydroxyectoine ABC transporter permease subunit EhuC [Shinella]MCD1262558.1 ectoine/hydroxyectoine ABC transporter permease subunit EhuC [Shinella sumterensis]MXN50774.1 ectoine/hydroxyectoine ABC transporter permease subunit EhuC [Shinella sp. AETb1-6]TFF00068.1 ectoine/hydroxyectoine ABC transporter permease subunit EhuC [Shinella sumterensis]UPA27626.1 ectoine/hydroxyectoine ABC transporter permease subunit EhuC [Shinella oryzae]WLS06063.1 ectoine/hydroxyectoine ABC